MSGSNGCMKNLKLHNLMENLHAEKLKIPMKAPSSKF